MKQKNQSQHQFQLIYFVCIFLLITNTISPNPFQHSYFLLDKFQVYLQNFSGEVSKYTFFLDSLSHGYHTVLLLIVQPLQSTDHKSCSQYMPAFSSQKHIYFIFPFFFLFLGSVFSCAAVIHFRILVTLGIPYFLLPQHILDCLVIIYRF